VLSDLVPLEHLGLKVYDLPTYADLDLVASKPSYFATRYGVTFANVVNQGWTGNFTSSSSGSLSQGYQDYLFFSRSIRPPWRISSPPISPSIP
jgi:hypothetical protein